MRQAPTKRRRASSRPEPTWDIAQLFPTQGDWSEEEYLGLPTNLPIEYCDGDLEFLPMPTTSHQRLVLYLAGLLVAFVTSRDLGEVLVAPLRVRMRRGKFREPDLVFMSKAHADRIHEAYWDGADLALEVMSADPADRTRDLVEKRRDYALARIPEYWIVDPQQECILVLRLSGKRYVVHGEFKRGQTATSHLLPGFAVDVTETFARAKAARKPRRRPRA